MKEIVTVKFKADGRGYYFDPVNCKPKVGEQVVVETANGLGVGQVTEPVHEVEDEKIVSPLKRVLRVADEKDLARIEENKRLEAEALPICEKMVNELKLDMRLVSAEYAFDGSKITFFFTADGRVDFRELVKKLASHFHTRIELRQIGVRDKARMLGGLGICGQPFCCHRFLNGFQPVSIKMAKEQGLPINPTNISGSCGRLMCCLKYEQNSYEYLASVTPPVGATVKMGGNIGTVVDSNPISGNLMVRFNGNESAPTKCKREEVQLISRKRQNNNSPKE
ncbi:MAG: stage 0 sporulation protein [Clostridia bacterium]|nr:stage 0 sporulation protein [Clostridia bacterium]